MKKLNYLAKLSLAAIVISGFALVSPVNSEDLKVGFVYVGPVSDHGWNYEHDQGRKALEKALGSKVKTSYVESVPEGADAARVITKMASSGHGLIYTTSFGYMNPTLKVAKKFPKVKFEHATGYKRSKNLNTYSARFYEGRHVAGLIAGKMTKSNVLGYVASFPIPEVLRGINATFLAARSVNPKVRIKIIWVSTWFDPGKEADAAKALIDQGADMIFTHTDSTAALQVAEKRGKFGFGQGSDMSKFAPKAHLTGIIDNWTPYYTRRAREVLNGTWKPADTWDGFKEGMVQLAPYNEVLPANVKAMAEKARKGIIDGSVHAFQGPIKDQSGKIVVKAGERANDGMLAGMNFYVEGVEGKIPK